MTEEYILKCPYCNNDVEEYGIFYDKDVKYFEISSYYCYNCFIEFDIDDLE